MGIHGDPDRPAGERHQALLLVGPTGSGKTPLGELAEAEGVCGRPCLHFDFGAALRACADTVQGGGGPPGLLSRPERDYLRRVVRTGALLEDEHFPVARKILTAFLEARRAGPGTLVVLNGLPRHSGQARAMETVVSVEAVVNLACGPETVLERVRTNAGGDRAGRTDDRAGDVLRRIETFRLRTAPLFEHYRSRGVRVIDVAVGPATSPQDMLALLERALAEGPARRSNHR